MRLPAARRIAAAIAVMLVGMGVAVVSGTAAQAATPVDWSANVADVNPGAITTGADGTVTIANCGGSGTYGTETFTVSGSLSGTTSCERGNVSVASFGDVRSQ